MYIYPGGAFLARPRSRIISFAQRFRAAFAEFRTEGPKRKEQSAKGKEPSAKGKAQRAKS
jgi:hypothetical protein